MIKKGFRYTIKFVKQKPSDNGTRYARFQIGDKIKDSNEYINFQVTVFDPPALNENDKITLDDINDIEARLYEGKLYYSMVAKVTPFTEPKAPEEPDEPLPFEI
jgi:hypothetical protein